MNLLSAVVLTSGGGGDMIHGLLFLLVIGIVLGIFYWLVQAAPFLNDLFKKVLGGIIILVGAIIITNFLLSLVGKGFISY